MDAVMGWSYAITGCLIMRWTHDHPSQAGEQQLTRVYNAESVPLFAVHIPLATAIET
jgi:hypothetical protein